MADPSPPRTTLAAAGWNPEYIESLRERYLADPDALDESWRWFFTGFDLATCPRSCAASTEAHDQARVASLIYAYRSEGHKQAAVNPLEDPVPNPFLDLSRFGFGDDDLDRVFDTGHLGGPSRAALGEIVAILEETYCGHVGVEYTHIQDRRVRRWLQARMEPRRNRPSFDRAKKLETLRLLDDAELFESFLHTRYLGQKRFSLEGAEALIPGLHALVELAPELGVREIVLGMAHRGRLNVLANILDKSYEMLFAEFDDVADRYMTGADGDVKYHKGFSHDHVNVHGRQVHVTLTANPSHLEAVDPVVEGRTRARQRRLGDTARRRAVVPLLIHGDAAFAGQGLVAETLNLSQLPGYRTGGTVHVIVDNQIGFTTAPSEARSSAQASDVARAIEAPVFHVNGDDPEAVVYAMELALVFRQEFGRDVVVDMVCYRRHGHNEADEPAFTQPTLYRAIHDHPPVRRQYLARLLDEGTLDESAAERLEQELRDRLQDAFEAVKAAAGSPAMTGAADGDPGVWQGLLEPFSFEPGTTAVDHAVLEQVAEAITRVPDGFDLNPKIARHLPGRLDAVRQGGDVSWATAEALAFGTLVREGHGVRLSGQDSARGTFAHRHAVWFDRTTGRPYTPLEHVHPDQARFCVHNSLLSEAAVLGFEYGYSLDEPQMLVLWEAQFGDFANGAQVIIDQFITAGQAKWGRSTGLVMLLPHGYEGQGPEHSNAYMERYLAACAEENIQVVDPSTPAQLFHVLRRQLARPFRRPLVVFSPKSLLRHPRVVSPVVELTGGRFHDVLDDPDPPDAPRRLVLCTGKLFHDLAAARDEDGVTGVALVRIEQIYPLNVELLRDVVGRHGEVEQVIWAQEETANRGAWTFLQPRLREALGRQVRYVGRAAAASPATGSPGVHRREQREIVRGALVG